MALLSNINDKFAVDSTGAIQFNGQVGTSGYILKSNANAAPTWVDPSTVIGGPYLPLSGGTLTGALAGTSATFAGNITGSSVLANSFMEIRSDTASFYFENAANNNYYRLKRSSNDFVIDYYNGTTTSDRLTINSSGNVGISGAPDLWYTGYTGVNIGYSGAIFSNNSASDTNVTALVQNAYLNSGATAWVYKRSDEANMLQLVNGEYRFYQASSGTAGNSISWNQNMTIDNSGNIGIKNTSPSDFLSWQQQLVVGSGSADAGITLYHGSGSGNQGAIVFADGNTGTDRYRGSISYNGADEMKFFTSTAERMRIDSNGQVEILNSLVMNAPTGSYIKFEYNSATRGYIGSERQIFTGGSEANMGYAATGDLVFGTGGSLTERMRITSAGSVGIGTTSPGSKLEVKTSGTNSVLELDNSDTNYTLIQYNASGATKGFSGFNSGFMLFGGESGTETRLQSGGLYAATILTNGNFGIGTTAPSQKLEVTGNFKLNGTVVQEGTGNNLTFKYRTGNSNAYTGGNATCKFGRFYWTPAHWVTGAPVIKVTLHCKYYQGERREYIIKAGYQDTDPIINELQPSSTSQKITLLVGATTSAGYNYAGQPVYYVDLQWVQTSYIWGWAEVESQVGFLTSNPTSTWGGVVMDSAITQTNNSGTPQNYTSFFAGNVGIGTTSPQRPLHINGTEGVARFTSTASGNDGFEVGIGTSSQAFLWQTENSYMQFATNNTERMRISSDGYLNAGGYTTASNTHHKIVTTRTNSETLRVENNSATPYGQIIRHGSAAPNTTDNWFLVCEDNAFSRLIIWSNGNVINRNNSYGGYSDIKLKENIVDATPKLDDLMKVKIRNYNLIGDDKKQIGVVAQELEEVFPSMIDKSKIPDSEDETLYKGVKYSVFVPMLIKAIQELEARVKELENK